MAVCHLCSVGESGHKPSCDYVVYALDHGDLSAEELVKLSCCEIQFLERDNFLDHIARHKMRFDAECELNNSVDAAWERNRLRNEY